MRYSCSACQSLSSLASGTELGSITCLGRGELVPVSSGLSYSGNILCDQEVLSRPEDPAASDSSFG